MNEDLENIYEGILINEDHSDPKTPVGGFLQGKSAVELLSILKKEKHDLYEAIEKAVEKLTNSED